MKEKVSEFQGDVKDSAHKIWLAGLGALSMAGEEGGKLFKSLVEKGEAFDSREKPPVEAVKNTYDKTREKASDLLAKVESNFNEKVATALQKLGVPSREELAAVNNRLDALMEALNKLNEQQAEVAEKPKKAKA